MTFEQTVRLQPLELFGHGWFRSGTSGKTNVPLVPRLRFRDCRFLQLLPLGQEGLAQVLQGQVAERRAAALVSPQADGALLDLLAYPPAPQAGLAEAVAARQDDGLSEHVVAHGTGKIVFGKGHLGGHFLFRSLLDGKSS